MTTYLVTGATGLIGRHVVDELLQRDETDRVLVLTRSSSLNRLDALRGRWPNADRVEPVIGDLAQPLLGIVEATLQNLIDQVDHVIHLAALYDITADDEESVLANVEGTRNVVAVASAIHAGCLHHVSSVAVAGDYHGTFTEDMFDEGQRLLTAYHRTKFAGEELVREQHDVPWRIYRPAIVVGNSKTGEMDKIDGPYYVFPAISRLAALPKLPVVLPDLGSTNIVPVDYVAKAMAHLVTKPGLDHRTFHLVNPKPQPITKIYDAFARAAGAPTVTAQLPKGLSDPLLQAGRAPSTGCPARTLARDAVLDRLGIPPVLLASRSSTPRSTRPRPSARWPAAASRCPRCRDYAGVLWRYWREHLDPFRARRHGQGGELDGRRMVITGASSGIGRSTALRVAELGGIPLLVARRAAELEELRDEIRAQGGDAYAYPCDLTDEESVNKAVAAMLAEHDGVDMLVNNAGRSIRRSVARSYDRFHDFERAMAINYFGAVRLILALLPQMTERRFGHIVNVSSIGVQGIAPRFSAYVASKAALDYFSKIVATETHGAGITFTTVHMPLVRTADDPADQDLRGVPGQVAVAGGGHGDQGAGRDGPSTSARRPARPCSSPTPWRPASSTRSPTRRTGSSRTRRRRAARAARSSWAGASSS